MKQRFGQPVVDTQQTIPFRFNGKRYRGHPGDHLASALMANNVQFIGRSPKFRRPRGFVSLDIYDPNALFTLDGQPNIPASEIELYAGMDVRSQAPLRFDWRAGLDIFAPFTPPGFFRKTFKWPRSFWRSIYEPILRQGAQAEISSQDEDTVFETGTLRCQILVVGSGMAGLLAAEAAAEAGHDVILAEGDFEFGGRLLCEAGTFNGQSYRDWRDAQLSKLDRLANLRMMKRLWINSLDPKMATGFERSAHNKSGIYWHIQADQIILATGARERTLLFAGNDRPNVMLASAARAAIHRFGVLPGQNIAIFSNNSSALALSKDLRAHDIEAVAVIDSAAGGRILKTYGRKALSHIRYEQDGRSQKIACDALAVSGGWNPNIELAIQLGAKTSWIEQKKCYVLKGLPKNIRVVGAANARFSDAEIAKDIEEQLADWIGKSKPIKEADDQNYQIADAWPVSSSSRAFVDYKDDVTKGDIQIAAQENFDNAMLLQRYAKLNANANSGALIGLEFGQEPEPVGQLSNSLPEFAYPIAARSGWSSGFQYQPLRRLPAETYLASQNVRWDEAALWRLPGYFSRDQETVWRQSVDRELGFAYHNLGVADRSHLAKFWVQGADAANFLDYICVKKPSKLKAGKLCTSLILREDGTVFDEVIIAALSSEQYLLTASAQRAAGLLEHCENMRQSKKFGCRLIDATDQFAHISLIGPKAKQLLDKYKIDTPTERFCVVASSLAGNEALLLTASAAGSQSYDLLVARSFGLEAIKDFDKKAQNRGGGLIGERAIDVLRQERGLISNAEIGCARIPQDLGVAFTRGRSCVGQANASKLAGLPDREQLVGLKPVGAVQRLFAGSVLIGVDEEPNSENLQGHVSSVCYSPRIGHMIGLAFLRNGHARLGEKIRAVDLVRDFDTLCEIVDPKSQLKDGSK